MSTEDERRHIAEMNARVRRSIERHGVKSERDRWALQQVSDGDSVIPPPDRAPLPPHFAKTCSREELAHLNRIVDDVYEWAQPLVGLTDHEATVLYNGDPVAMLIRNELIGWGLEYARARLARPNARDQGDPFLRWRRITDEVCIWLDTIGTVAGIRVALSDVADRIAWEIWRATLGPEVGLRREGKGLWFDMPRVAPERWQQVQQTVLLYAWNEADALELARARFTRRASGDVAELRRRRAQMGEDLVEVRSLLVGSDPIGVAGDSPGGSSTLIWGYQHAVGFILVAPDREALAAQVTEALYPAPLRLHLDGAIAGHVTWWELADDPAWEVAMIEPMHANLVEQWLAQAPTAAPTEAVTTIAGDLAVVADACQRIAEPVQGRRVPAVRMETLLTTLERRFSCDVSPGKGSEITVYRFGGRKFTLGHHARNTHVPAHVVRALLKAVGISVGEWWTVLDR